MVWETRVKTFSAKSHNVAAAATNLAAEQDSTSGGSTPGKMDAEGDRQVGTRERRMEEMYFAVQGDMGQLDAARDSASQVWGLQFRKGVVTFDATALGVFRASELWLLECVDYHMQLWDEYRTQQHVLRCIHSAVCRLQRVAEQCGREVTKVWTRATLWARG